MKDVKTLVTFLAVGIATVAVANKGYDIMTTNSTTAGLVAKIPLDESMTRAVVAGVGAAITIYGASKFLKVI